MKVICRSDVLTEEQEMEIGLAGMGCRYPHLEVGMTYTVLGLSCGTGIPGGTLLDIPGEVILPSPLSLFEIVDGRPSRHWLARKTSDSRLVLQPQEFYMEDFHDRLSDLEPALVEIYRQVRQKLEWEYI